MSTGNLNPHGIPFKIALSDDFRHAFEEIESPETSGPIIVNFQWAFDLVTFMRNGMFRPLTFRHFNHLQALVGTARKGQIVPLSTYLASGSIFAGFDITETFQLLFLGVEGYRSGTRIIDEVYNFEGGTAQIAFNTTRENAFKYAQLIVDLTQWILYYTRRDNFQLSIEGTIRHPDVLGLEYHLLARLDNQELAMERGELNLFEFLGHLHLKNSTAVIAERPDHIDGIEMDIRKVQFCTGFASLTCVSMTPSDNQLHQVFCLCRGSHAFILLRSTHDDPAQAPEALTEWYYARTARSGITTTEVCDIAEVYGTTSEMVNWPKLNFIWTQGRHFVDVERAAHWQGQYFGQSSQTVYSPDTGKGLAQTAGSSDELPLLS